MTGLILVVAYMSAAAAVDVYLCQDLDYRNHPENPGPRLCCMAFWPIVLLAFSSVRERQSFADDVAKSRAAADAALDRDIAEVLDLIEYQQHNVDPWLTLQPRGSEQCL